MNIQAIETIYKGYRFRSRLEARWAVVFDKAGLRWQYEAEGYAVDGQRYLPDFYLEDHDALIEIKPRKIDNDRKVVYMAGKMGNNDEGEDWRNWRPLALPDYLCDKAYAHITDENGREYYYTGPFGGLYGNSHDPSKHGLIGGYDEEAIVHNSFSGIRTSNIVLVLIDELDCYGTIVEIGFAAALDKTIYTAFVIKDDIPESKDGFYSYNEFRDMWFALRCSTKYQVFRKDKSSALNWLFEQAGITERPERRLLRSVADGLKKSWSLVYGSPGEHSLSCNFDFARFLPEHAILAGQQARFEHGESGYRA